MEKKMVKKYSESGKMFEASTGKRFDYVYEEPEAKKTENGKAATGKDRTRGVMTTKIEVYNKIIDTLGVKIEVPTKDKNGKDRTADEIADDRITEIVKIGNDFMANARDYFITNFDLISQGATLVLPKPKTGK